LVNILNSQGKKITKEGRKIQDRCFDAERYMKSMRLLQMSQRDELIDEEEDERERLRDPNLFLYRQTVPDFDERCKFLEEKLVVRKMLIIF
jgi:hypothetical protein